MTFDEWLKKNSPAGCVSDMERGWNAALAEVAALRAERDAALVDAERYRWLRDNASCQWDLDYQHVEVVFPLDEEEWEDMDDAVDSAIAAKKESTHG